MSNSEVNSLSNQAEKILDIVSDHVAFIGKEDVDRQIKRAGVLAELAKAHALVDLAEAIRESITITHAFNAVTDSLHVSTRKDPA